MDFRWASILALLSVVLAACATGTAPFAEGSFVDASDAPFASASSDDAAAHDDTGAPFDSGVSNGLGGTTGARPLHRHVQHAHVRGEWLLRQLVVPDFHGGCHKLPPTGC